VIIVLRKCNNFDGLPLLTKTRFYEMTMIIHFKRLGNRSTRWQTSLYVGMLIIWGTFIYSNYYSICFVWVLYLTAVRLEKPHIQVLWPLVLSDRCYIPQSTVFSVPIDILYYPICNFQRYNCMDLCSLVYNTIQS
jgi:hypothetical protein